MCPLVNPAKLLGAEATNNGGEEDCIPSQESQGCVPKDFILFLEVLLDRAGLLDKESWGSLGHIRILALVLSF